MKRRIAVGDVHGCQKTLHKLLFENIRITKKDEIYLLGDLIDRGPAIKQVVDDVIRWREEGYWINCIIGNHEWLLLKALESEENYELWMRNDGLSTLKSFHINDIHHLPKHYVNFFMGMAYHLETAHFVIVHGGLNFNLNNPFEDRDSMVWARNRFVDLSKTKNKRLIVGHTPTPLNEILESNKTDRIRIDGGCVYDKIHKGLGFLVAYDLDKDEFFYERNSDN